MKVYRQDEILEFCNHTCTSDCRRDGCDRHGCTCGGQWHEEKSNTNFKEQWAAEETLGEGLLKYRKVVWAPTKLEAIDKMIQEIYLIKLNEIRTNPTNG